MRKLFLICTTTIVAYGVTAPSARAYPVTSTTVLHNCDGALQSALGAYGCTLCNGSGSRCIDYSCNTNPNNGARLGCWAEPFIAQSRGGQSLLQATPMFGWPPGWLYRNAR